MHHLIIPLILTLCIVSAEKTRTVKTVELSADEPQRLTLPGRARDELVILRPRSVTQSVRFIVCQVHSQYKNVTLSLNPTVAISTSKTGTNVGVISKVTADTFSYNFSWYLTHNHNDSISVLAGIYFGFQNGEQYYFGDEHSQILGKTLHVLLTC